MHQRSNLLRLLVSLGIIGWIMGCQIDNLKDPIIIPGIEKELYIDLWERLLQTNNILSLQVETIEDESCTNVNIRTSLVQSNQYIDFDILSITQPNDCIPGEAPARGEALVGQLANGLYDINVHLQNEIASNAKLEVTPEYFRITPGAQIGFSWKHTELRRVPAQTLWGYVSATESSLLSDALEAQAALMAMGAATGLPEGYYGYFIIDNNGNLEVKDAPTSPVLLPFLISYDGSDQAVTQLVQSLRQQSPAGLQISVFSGKGAVW